MNWGLVCTGDLRSLYRGTRRSLLPSSRCSVSRWVTALLLLCLVLAARLAVVRFFAEFEVKSAYLLQILRLARWRWVVARDALAVVSIIGESGSKVVSGRRFSVSPSVVVAESVSANGVDLLGLVFGVD